MLIHVYLVVPVRNTYEHVNCTKNHRDQGSALKKINVKIQISLFPHVAGGEKAHVNGLMCYVITHRLDRDTTKHLGTYSRSHLYGCELRFPRWYRLAIAR